jgi:hypothetical protein
MKSLTAAATSLLALLALGSAVSAEESPRPAPAYRVIVNPKTAVTSLSRTFLQDAFLKKTGRWPDDGVIRPADLTANVTRIRFSEEVLGRSLAAVRAYWQQRIFSGRDVPPPELDTDAKVVAYVLKYEGAIGYVSGTANIGAAKAVSVSP